MASDPLETCAFGATCSCFRNRPPIFQESHLTLVYTRDLSLTVVSSSISNKYSEISAPLDSGLLHERPMKLTPALSSLGDEGAEGAPALVMHFNSLLNLL